MSVAAGSSVAAQAADRVLAKLQGTRPDHDPRHARIGVGLADGFDARLRAVFPLQLAPAAVLVGLVEHVSEPSLLLTVRAAHLRHHAGQIAFPGGRIETDDIDPAGAAIREAQEEIGLPPQHVSVVGFLPDHLVMTGYRVTPVVARITPGFTLRFDPGEVQEVFELPWSQLLDPANHHESRRSFAGIELPVRDIHYDGHRIWGATAGILLTLYELAQESVES